MTPKRFLAVRKALGIKQTEMADSLGVTAQAVWYWETGRAKPKALHLTIMESMERALLTDGGAAAVRVALFMVREREWTVAKGGENCGSRLLMRSAAAWPWAELKKGKGRKAKRAGGKKPARQARPAGKSKPAKPPKESKKPTASSGPLCGAKHPTFSKSSPGRDRTGPCHRAKGHAGRHRSLAGANLMGLRDWGPEAKAAAKSNPKSGAKKASKAKPAKRAKSKSRKRATSKPAKRSKSKPAPKRKAAAK